MTLGKRLRAARKAKGFTQKQLEELTGVDRSTISNIETDKPYGYLGESRATSLAAALDVPVTDILGQPVDEHEDAQRQEADRKLDDLLATLAKSADREADALVVEVLGLLAHRVRLAESQREPRARRATRAAQSRPSHSLGLPP